MDASISVGTSQSMDSVHSELPSNPLVPNKQDGEILQTQHSEERVHDRDDLGNDLSQAVA